MSRFGNPHRDFMQQPNMQQNINSPNMQQMPMQNQMYPGMQPQMYPGMQPQMYPGMQPQMYPGMQPQMYPGMQPQMYPGMQQMSMQNQMYPGMQQQMYPGMQQSHRFMPRGVMPNNSTNVRFGQTDVNMNTEDRYRAYSQEDFKQGFFENTISTTRGISMDEANILDLEIEVCVDCFEEAIETIIEQYYQNKSDKILSCLSKIDVAKTFYDTQESKNSFLSLFKHNDVEFLKNLNKVYFEQKTKECIVAAKEINQYFTEEVNEWLEINTSEKISIDSFKDDYNELLSVISANSFILNALQEYVNKKIQEIDKVYEVLSDKDNKNFVFVNPYVMSYINFISSDLNLNKIGFEDYLLISKTKSNTIFLSLSDQIFGNYDIGYFMLVTLDRKCYKILKSLQRSYFITRVF